MALLGVVSIGCFGCFFDGLFIACLSLLVLRPG